MIKINNVIKLDDQIKGMKGQELKNYIKMKYNYYKSSPQGCIDYIQECLQVAKPGVGYAPFELWDTQKNMIYDIVDCMFNPNKNMYILLGSRQCGKTTCMTALADWATTFYSKYNVVLIHTDDKRGKNTCEEFRMLRNLKSKLMYYKPKKNALTHQIFWNDSSFQLQSSQKSKSKGDTDSGRGLSVNLLWVDEASTVDLDRLQASVFPTTSTTFIFSAENHIPYIILLSGTANGRVGIGKKFYDLWKKVEPPLNKSNKYMGGYLLIWKDIPIKTQEWYNSWKETMSEREIHQEFDCVFYGTQTSLFSDDQIIKIQDRSSSIKNVETNYKYVCPSGHIANGTFYSKIQKNHKYIIGADIAKGTGNDNSVIEIIDYDNLNQVFELIDDEIQHNDLVKLFNNIVLTLLKQNAKIIISIEANMTGTAIISDLIALNPMYKLLIYKNTIGPDLSVNNKNVSYNECSYGVTITGSTSNKESVRDILIDYIINYVNNNLNCIHSKYLISEIESLEIDKNGKIVGIPHDDSVFALGHTLLIKYRGRVQNIHNIFMSCDDILNDSSYRQIIDLSLSNYNDDTIQEALDYVNNQNDSLLFQSTGMFDTLTKNQQSIDNNLSISKQLESMPFNINNNSLIFNENGTINSESLSILRQSLSMQTKIIEQQVEQKHKLLNMQNKSNPLIENLSSNNKKNKKKLISYNSSNDINYIPMTDSNDEWLDFVMG